MARLIDADAFKSYIACGHLRSPNELCFSEIDVVRMIDKQPTVNAEPVQHGRWEYWGFDARCSVCGYWNNADRVTRVRSDPSYCPWCHAKMDGKDNNVPAKPEQHHRPEECVYYATRQHDGRGVCLGTREVDPCDGAGCKRWKPKKDGGATNG